MIIDNMIKRFKEFYNKSIYNKLFLIVLSLSLIYFVYYFIKTFSQALWFDEADYLNYARYLANGFPIATFSPIRPILFSLIASSFFKLHLGELASRILMGLFYFSNIILVYLIGKEMFDDFTALAASIFTAIFWSHLFFSYRLLVDVPVLTFWLLTVLFFFKGYVNKKDNIYTLLLIPTLILGFLMKYTNALLAIIIILYLVITERFSFIKNKNLIKSTLISFILLIPFFIWQYVSYGSPIAFFLQTFGTRTTLGRSFIDSLITQLKSFLSIEGIILMVLSILGFLYLLQIFLGLDIIIKNKDKALGNKLFLFLWIVLTILFAAKINYGYYIEERYYFNFFIGLFLAAGLVLSKLYNLLKKYNKYISTIVIVLIIVFIVNSNIEMANSNIITKADSFKQVKEAGIWLNQHLSKDEGYISPATSAEIQYHSERQNYAVDISEAFTNPKIKYVVLSFFNQMPDKFIEGVKNNQDKLKPVVSFYLVDNDKQPIVLILEVKK